MNVYIHLIISTSFSMIITFIVRYVLHQTRVDSSIVQQYVSDVMRDFMLSIRCLFDGRNGMLFVINNYKVLTSLLFI
jgi:hypothetical protein